MVVETAAAVAAVYFAASVETAAAWKLQQLRDKVAEWAVAP
jgi:hypothetical protein